MTRNRTIIITTFAVLASILSKENGVLIVLGIAVLEMTLPGSPPKKHLPKGDKAAPCSALVRSPYDVLIFFGVLVGTMFLLLGYDTVRIVHDILSPGQAGEFTGSERLLTEGRVLVSDLGLFLFPVPSRLSLVMKRPLPVSIVIAFAHRNHLPSVFLSMPAAGWLPGPAD